MSEPDFIGPEEEKEFTPVKPKRKPRAKKELSPVLVPALEKPPKAFVETSKLRKERLGNPRTCQKAVQAFLLGWLLIDPYPQLKLSYSTRPWPEGLGPWSTARGPLPMVRVPWALAHGPWPMGLGPMGFGPWALAHGPGPWALAKSLRLHVFSVLISSSTGKQRL